MSFFHSIISMSGYHPKAASYFARVEAKGGTFTDEQKEAFNNLFITLNDNGDLNSILELWDSGVSFSGCEEKLIYPAGVNSYLTFTNLTSSNWTLNDGLLGNGTNGYASTGFNPSINGLDKRNGFYGTYRNKAGFRNSDLSVPTNMPLGGTSSTIYLSTALTSVTHPFQTVLSARTLRSNYSDGLQSVVTDGTGVRTYSRGFLMDSAALATAGTEDQTIELFRYNSAAYSKSNLNGYVIGIGTDMDAARIARISEAIETLNSALGRVNLTTTRNIFFGDSITFGQGATTYANSWVYLLNTALGGKEVNMGVGGSMLQNTSPSAATNGRDRYLSHVVANIVDPANTNIFILYGVNDLRYNNVNYSDTEFKTDLQFIVDDLISRGVPNANITIGSPSYLDPSDFATTSAPFNAGSVEKQEAYVAAVLDVATTREIKYGAVYEYMLANGSTTLVGADGTHPNNAGHSAISTAMLAATIPV